jgi:hypothetical protein
MKGIKLQKLDITATTPSKSLHPVILSHQSANVAMKTCDIV